MPRFRFRAVTGTGEVVQGEIEAQSQAAVVEQLRGQGHLPLAAEPVAGATLDGRSTLQEWLRQPVFGGRVRRREIAVMTRELATLLDAALTVDQSLRLLVDLAESETMRRLLADLLERIQGGSTLADALGQHEEAFSRAYISMVRAGEAGGALDDVLGRLAQYLEQTEVLAEQVRSALVYPIVLLIFSGLSIAILLTVVVPQFTPLFESAGADLPLLTRVVIAVGDAARHDWWLLLMGLLALVWLVRRQFRQPESRARIDRWMLRLPLLGGLLVKIDTARLARTLGALLANGVPLLSALSIARETLANAVLRAALSETATAVKEGRGLAEPLAKAGPFPLLAVRLLAVGEKSGHLDAMLLKIAEIFDREVRRTVERLMTLLVPALTIGLGLIIASIIGAVLAAILSAYQLPL
ncbi:MAG: type II secretion system F family protein [Geminicoccaceae bacterium]